MTAVTLRPVISDQAGIITRLREEKDALRDAVKRGGRDAKARTRRELALAASTLAWKKRAEDAERQARELSALVPRHDSRAFLVAAGISSDGLDDGEESAVVAELLDRVAELERRNAQLTATVDGLQAQMAALTSFDDIADLMGGDS